MLDAIDLEMCGKVHRELGHLSNSNIEPEDVNVGSEFVGPIKLPGMYALGVRKKMKVVGINHKKGSVRVVFI